MRELEPQRNKGPLTMIQTTNPELEMSWSSTPLFCTADEMVTSCIGRRIRSVGKEQAGQHMVNRAIVGSFLESKQLTVLTSVGTVASRGKSSPDRPTKDRLWSHVKQITQEGEYPSRVKVNQ